MENDSKIGAFFQKVWTELNEQSWFQALKSKWEELDPQSRRYLSTALSITGAALVLYVVISSVRGTYALRTTYEQKTELLAQIQSATQEINTLKALGGGGFATSSPDGKAAVINWQTRLGDKARAVGITDDSVTVSPEKPGMEGQMTKEVLLDLKLKKVNIKQVIRLAYDLENDSQPVKIRNLLITTEGEEGYLNATLALSAFTMKN